MSLTNRQAFKFGFLLRCADEGLSREETEQRINLGIQKLAGILGDAVNTGTDLAKFVALKAPFVGLGAVTGIGGLGGLLAAKATEGDVDADDYKKQELISRYTMLAQQAKDRARRQPHLLHHARSAGA